MSRPTLLLVHGAWHGSWAFEPLESILVDRGWTVETVDLPTVHADDKATLTLQHDADAVAAAIDSIEGPVVVVAHSYGGVPTTQGATDPKVAHIVYIAAFALDEGESLLGAVGGVAPDWWVIDGPLSTAGNDELPPHTLFFNDMSEAEAEPAIVQLLSQAVQPFSDTLTQVAWRGRPTTYLITENDTVFPVVAQEALAARAGSQTARLASSHSPFLSQPDAVADVIEKAAQSVA